MTRLKLADSTLTQKLKLTPEEPPKTKTIVGVDEARELYTQTQRVGGLRRDGKFIVVVWRDLASRSKDEMNPTVHSDDTVDYSNLHHITRMSPEDPKTSDVK